MNSATVYIWYQNQVRQTMVNDLPEATNWWTQTYEVDRFGIAATHLRGSSDAGPLDELRILDVVSGTTLAGRKLYPGEFLLRSPALDSMLHVGYFGAVDGESTTLTVEAYRYAPADLVNNKLPANSGIVSFTLPAEAALLANQPSMIQAYMPPSASADGYLVVSMWGNQLNPPYAFVLHSDGSADWLDLPPDSGWVSNAFLSDGALMVEMQGDNGSSFHQFDGAGWVTVLEDDFWTAHDAALAPESIIRLPEGGVIDLLDYAAPGSAVSIQEDRDPILALGNQQYLVRASVKGPGEGLEHEVWLLCDGDGTVSKSLVFDYKLHSIYSPDGYVQFQVLNLTLDPIDPPSSVQGLPAVSLYRIAVADLATVLGSESVLDVNSLTALAGVELLVDFTAEQLTGMPQPAGTVVYVEAYLSADMLPTGSLGSLAGLALGGVYDSATDSDSSYLSGQLADGTAAWVMPVQGIQDLHVHASTGIFIDQWDEATQSHVYSRIDPVDGSLVKVPLDLWEALDLGQVPDNAVFIEGTPGPDGLSSTAPPEQLAIFVTNAGNDTVLGRDGTDVVWLGAGDDRVVYRNPSELVDDYIDGGAERTSTDRIQLNAAADGMVFDLRQADAIDNIDRVQFGVDRPGLGLILDSTVAETADVNQDGTMGDLKVVSRLSAAGTEPAMLNGVSVDGSALLANQQLVFEGKGYSNDGGVTWLAGFAGDDMVMGGAGADSLHGGKGHDNLSGGAGNDSLAGGAGNDQIDGGAGNDSVYYADVAANYTFTRTVDGWTVQDMETVNGDEGTDTLTGIENLYFNGERFVPDNQAPQALADEATILANASATGNLLDNDSDADIGAVLSVTEVAGQAVQQGNLGTGGFDDGVTGSTLLPTVLTDGTGFAWDVMQTGAIGDGTSDAYDWGLQLTHDFPGPPVAATEESGREIVFGAKIQEASGGFVEVTRKVYVPADQGYARYLEIVHNPGSETVSYDAYIYTDLGSDGTEPFVQSSSGDSLVDANDNWVVTDDTPSGTPASSWQGDPVVTHVVSGNGAAVKPSYFRHGSGSVDYSYNLILAPGETKIVMHFASQSFDQAAAVQRAQQLTELQLDALQGMSAEERAQVVNFDFGGVVVDGQYGKLELGSDGRYVYTPDSRAAALLAGETVTETFSYTVSDENGSTAQSELNVTVEGVNDAPTLSLSANQINENVVVGTGVHVGDVVVEDPDLSGNANVLSLSGNDVGSFELREGNQLWYTGESPDYESRSEYSLTVTSTDGEVTSQADLTVQVQDVNEPVQGELWIDGVPVAGTVLNVYSTLWDQDWLEQVSYSWFSRELVDGIVVETELAQGSSYTLPAELVGKTIFVKATLVDAFGSSEVLSDATTEVQPEGRYPIMGTPDADSLYGDNRNEDIYGLDSSDYIDGGAGSDYLDGGVGDDSLISPGSMGNHYRNYTSQPMSSTLVGGTGNDNLTAWWQSQSSLSGGDDNDRLDVFSVRSATLAGGSGSDNLYVNYNGNYSDITDGNRQAPESYRLDGGEGDDYLNVTGSSHLNVGRNGLLYNDGEATATLLGGAGNDLLEARDYSASDNSEYGMSAASLDGGDGNDMLIASGVLQASLTGGTGSDTFVLTRQQYDTQFGGERTVALGDGTAKTVKPDPLLITDFEAGAGGDVLDLSDLAASLDWYAYYQYGQNPFTDGRMSLVQSGADTHLRVDGNVAAVLRGVTATDLTAANFWPAYRPVGLTLTDLEDTGSSATDLITKDNSFTLSGTPPIEGSLVRYEASTDGGKTWGATDALQNNLLDGSYQFRAQFGGLQVTQQGGITVTQEVTNGVATLSFYLSANTPIESLDFILDYDPAQATYLSSSTDTVHLPFSVSNDRQSDSGTSLGNVYFAFATDKPYAQLPREPIGTVQLLLNGGISSLDVNVSGVVLNDVMLDDTVARVVPFSTSAPVAVTVDTSPPAAPGVALDNDSGVSDSDHVTNVGTLSVTGVEDGDQVEYSTDGGSSWSSSFMAAEGLNNVQVRVSDVAGNHASTNFSFTLDTGTAFPAVALVSDSGNSTTDKITNAGALSVTGVEAGGVVEYSIDGANSWSSSFSAKEGANVVKVRVTDAAGNQALRDFGFTLDTATTAPVVGLISDSGASASDKITQLGTLSLTGVEDGAKIEYSTNGGSQWSSSFTAVEGVNNVKVRVTDVAGNQASTDFSFTLDTTAPAAPVVGLSSDSGASDTDRITQVGTLSVTGVEVDDVVEYSIDGGNSWSSSFSAAEGANSVKVRVTDLAGNQASTDFSFTLDTVAPEAPVVGLSSDSGVSDSDGVTNVGTLAVTGVETGAQLEYRLNGGSWSDSFTAVEGINDVEVRATDAAGNQASTYFSFTLDTGTQAPVVGLSHDSGASASDRITNDPSLTVAGLEDGAVVEYSTDGGSTWASSFSAVEGVNTVKVRVMDTVGNLAVQSFSFVLDTRAVAGQLTFINLIDTGESASDLVTSDNGFVLSVSGNEAGSTVEYYERQLVDGTEVDTLLVDGVVTGASDGEHSYVAKVVDLAGNMAETAVAKVTLVDTVPPQGVTLVFTDLVDSGKVGDLLTNDRNFSLSISDSSDVSKVEYYERQLIDGNVVDTLVVDGVVTNATDGQHDYYAKVTDLAGNVAETGLVSLTVDTVTNAAAVGLRLDSGNSDSDRFTNSGLLSVTGVESGAQVEYSTDGGSNWSNSFSAKEGANSVTVRVTDVAGNQASTNFSFTLDSSTIAPSVALSSDSGVSGSDRITNIGTLSVTGFEAGGLVEYSTDSGSSWSSSFSADEGVNSVKVRVTDVAGNQASTDFSFTLDTSTAKPSVALSVDSGASSSDGITKVGALNVTGVEEGAKVEYSIDGGSNWSSSFSAKEGGNSVKVRVTDVAGNQASTDFSFTLDTVIAAPSVALVSDTGNSTTDKITSDGTLTVTSEAGATVQYSIDGGSSWSSSFSAAEGVNSVKVRVTDVAGNQASTDFSFTLDTSTAKPSVALSVDSGVSDTDGVTDVGTLTVTGVETGAQVEYRLNGGNWSNSFTAVQGVNDVEVRSTDAAGNQASTLFSFVFDDQAPQLTSGFEAASIDENSAPGQFVYQATSNENDVLFSLRQDGDGAEFSIDPLTGEVRFIGQANFEDKSSYSFTVVTSDAAGNAAQQAVKMEVRDLNDSHSGSVWFDGLLKQGETLTAYNDLSDEDGIISLDYEWLVDGQLAGTGASFTLNQASVGSTVTLRAVYADGFGPVAVDSEPQGPVVPLGEIAGQVYHWKTHALLDQVEFALADVSSVTTPAPDAPSYELRNISVNSDGIVSGEVWVLGADAVNNLDLSLDFAGNQTAGFQPSLQGWAAAVSVEAGVVGLSAITQSSPISGEAKLGTLTFDLKAGDATQMVTVSGHVGDSLVTAYQAELGYQLDAIEFQTSIETGGFQFSNLDAGLYGLIATRTVGESDEAVITSSDALAALKLAVGRELNVGEVASPYQFIAADANEDGRVTSDDALAILKMAVHHDQAPAYEWLFVSESADFWDENANDGVGAFTITRNSVVWNDNLLIEVDGSESQNLVAVLKGDVNGNWAAPLGSEFVDDSHFVELVRIGVGTAAQWGIPDLPV